MLQRSSLCLLPLNHLLILQNVMLNRTRQVGYDFRVLGMRVRHASSKHDEIELQLVDNSAWSTTRPVSSSS
jgi:hypothetical protein